MFTRTALRGSFYEKNGSPLEITLFVHPLESEVIIINYPGFNGEAGGYNDKYVKIAEMLREKKVGAVVRMRNTYMSGIDYKMNVVDDLSIVIDYVLKNTEDICGDANPEIYLMGNSAGASAIAAVAANFSEVTKILLNSLSADAGQDAMEAGLKKFPSDIYIAYGQEDYGIGVWSAKFVRKILGESAQLHMVGVPNCDHEFRGTTNGMILSKTSLWAFAGDKTFPSPEGGIEIY